jgi:hypothetical protein
MSNAGEFLTSKFLNAMSLEPGVQYEATVLGTYRHTFENGETKLMVVTDYLEKGISLNQTRLQAMINAFGVNDEVNWPGKKVVIYQGDTLYLGKPVKCVVIEPIVPERIAAEPKRTIGSTDVRSGRGAWNDNAPPVDRYDGPDDDDRIEY